jgi:hypothetical protein
MVGRGGRDAKDDAVAVFDLEGARRARVGDDAEGAAEERMGRIDDDNGIDDGLLAMGLALCIKIVPGTPGAC